ncbi:Di-heme cytochrome, transmembrane [Trema orientale]|uniref:Di-heme cytochrome, transmembrane n=1 Tax=Trema orientale TaxID=63057 RepID=A0A2P5FVE2_TREOI|nr:Di-heme cytochrome, transmembrane [Trema orientale]
MAMVTASTSLHLGCRFSLLHSPELPKFQPLSQNHGESCFKLGPSMETTRRRPLLSPLLVKNDTKCCEVADNEANDENEEDKGEPSETLLYSFIPLPLMLVAALPGAGALRSLFGPFVELVKSWNLPDWLVHWGHPGNMAVVLFAMGGYGTYLGFRIRFSDDLEEKAKAKDLHPKLLAGMFFFFALGATGGITSLLTSDKPIFESPHAVTGFIGLSLLTIQTILPTLFEGNPGLRNVHGILGSGIMTLFLVHAALGLQLGLSY